MKNNAQAIGHWIDNAEIASAKGFWFEKKDPATGKILYKVSEGSDYEVRLAIKSALDSYKKWAETNVVKRSEIIREAVLLIRARKKELAEIVAKEAGKPLRDASGEVDAAVECGFFFAGEGRRYFGSVLQSASLNRRVQMRRYPIGVGALIIPFNNPAANVAWKLFPAILCGNAVVMKAHEYIPSVPVWFAKVLKEAGLPPGVFSVLQGLGNVGASLVADPRVSFVSFTGGVNTGRAIKRATAERFAKTQIESGGKNALVICDDADLERAVNVSVQSATVDAGQRCVGCSRIIIFENVYDKCKAMLLEKLSNLKVGVGENDAYGAIISEDRMNAILEAIKSAVSRGATLLLGGERLTDREHKNGYFIKPTVLENVDPNDPLSQEELFGPVVALYRAKHFEEAISLTNNSKFGLSAAIHTNNIHRAEIFMDGAETGVVRVNGPTFGSEPHMPFGGVKLSGDGWREPGEKALDFYSNWKQISIDFSPESA